MTPDDIAHYVASAAKAQDLPLDAAQLQRVAIIFGRNAGIARLVVDFDLPDTIEAGPVFTP